MTALSGCQSASNSSPPVDAATAADNRCGEAGFLTTQLYGALETGVQWDAADLECEGMRRPDGMGARLRFAGITDDGHRVAFIIALPGLQPGVTGSEFGSKVTLIEEGNGRFFSSAELDICWTDIVDLQGLDHGDASAQSRFAIHGNAYCVAPLAEVNGAAAVMIRDLEFRGLLDWNAS